MNLTIEILKKNYLNDNTKKDYTNNHMTSKIIQCKGKNKESINILVVNRSKREERGWVDEKSLKLMDQDNIDNLCYLTARSGRRRRSHNLGFVTAVY